MTKTDFNIEKLGIKDPFKEPLRQKVINGLTQLWEQFKPSDDKFKQVESTLSLLRLINFILSVIIVCVVVRLGFGVFSTSRQIDDFKKQVDAVSQPSKSISVVYAPGTPVKDLNQFKTRSIFTPYLDPRTLLADQEKETEKAYKELSKKFSVVGIMMGETPTAIIEERKTGSTYFVKPQDAFRSAVVEVITPTAVQLSFKGHVVELPL